MAGSSAAGQMGGSQERSDSGADDKPPGGVGLEDGGQMGLDLLPAERADGMVIKGAEELVELLMVGPAEMVLGGGRRASRIAQLNYLDAKRIPQQPRTSRSRCQSER